MSKKNSKKDSGNKPIDSIDESLLQVSNKKEDLNDSDSDIDDIIDSDDMKHYIIIIDILRKKISDREKSLLVIKYFENYYFSLKTRNRFNSEWDKMKNQFSLTTKKSKKNKTCSSLANLFCFIPNVCCKSSLFIIQVIVSFIFIICVILVLGLVKRIIGL